MSIIDALKGRLTATCTGFGRPYRIFQSLENDLNK
jgi:hypothetical protein